MVAWFKIAPHYLDNAFYLSESATDADHTTPKVPYFGLHESQPNMAESMLFALNSLSHVNKSLTLMLWIARNCFHSIPAVI